MIALLPDTPLMQLYAAVLAGIIATVAICAPVCAQQVASPDVLQAQLSQIHSQIAGLGVKALDVDNANANNIERRLLDLQKRMHVITEGAGRANLTYLRRTSRSNKQYLLIMQQGDLLDAEADAISNYLDTQDSTFSGLISDLERLVNRIEP